MHREILQLKSKDTKFSTGTFGIKTSRCSGAREANKLTPNWKGPYKVTKVLSPSAYKLQTLEGIPVKNAWNVQNLRKFYQ